MKASERQREWREWRFRFERDDQQNLTDNAADLRALGESEQFLPALFCSPTMELGVDISALNAVYLRNVPPTPANYAQRAGRAGRSGQAAVIVTYFAAQSPHDQYFFERRGEMVAGPASDAQCLPVKYRKTRAKLER
ncbi:helicase-related protein [Paraburkholderia dioscoreae]|nr:helicase-related protein [Paraburkholderia dioscoreae]